MRTALLGDARCNICANRLSKAELEFFFDNSAQKPICWRCADAKINEARR